MRIVRLGEGIDRTGEFSPGRPGPYVRRARRVRRRDGGRAASSASRFVATSASRDASNRDALRRGRARPHRRRAGGRSRAPRRRPCPSPARCAGCPPGWSTPPALVVDIGGGSTEFVLGDDAAASSRRASTSGCVRMTERHLVADPPTRGPGRRDVGRHRGGRRPGGRRASRSTGGAVPRRAGRLGHHGGRDGDGPAGVRRAAPARGGHPGGRRDGRDSATAGDDAARAGRPAVHAPRTRGRDRRRRHGADRPRCAAAGAEHVIVSETDILDGIVYRLAAE